MAETVMRRVLVLIAILVTSWCLASCAPESSPPAAVAVATPARTIPTAGEPAPLGTVQAVPPGSPTATVLNSASPSPTAVTLSTPELAPAGAASSTPAATPTAPSFLAPTAGEPVSFSLQKVLEADVHLTAGVATRLGDQPVYLLASLDRNVYAVAADGELRWRVRAVAPVYALAVISGERIAVGDDAGYVTVLDGDGVRLWRHWLGSRVTALLGGYQDGLLAGGWDNRLTLLADEPGSQQVRWQADLGGPVSGIVALAGLAVASTLDGAVIAVDANGIELWRFDAAATVAGLGAAPHEKGILVGVQDGRLLALGLDGKLLWERRLGEGSPVWYVVEEADAADSEIVVGTGGTEPLVGLLTSQGEWQWRLQAPAGVGAVTALELDGDGQAEILAGLDSGAILAFDRQGHSQGSTAAGLPVWGFVTGPEQSARGALVLADVLAWRLDEGKGLPAKPRLSPPAMLLNAPELLPQAAQAASIPPEANQATLVFLGDVSLSRSMELQLARYGPDYVWGGLGALLSGADLAMANLETCLTVQGRPMNKPYLIRAHPRWAEVMVSGGLDAVTLSNNHALDFGLEGLDETLGIIDAVDVAVVGAGRTTEQAHQPALFTLNGVRVAVLGYLGAYWNGSADVPATDRLAWADPEVVQADVRAVRDQADVVVVVLHAGREYTATPSESQVTVAHAAVDAGADLVVGHHPHVTQTVEQYKGRLIVYSLGDTVFDIPRPGPMQGDLLRAHVTQDGLVQAELWPFWIDGGIRPRLLDNGQGEPRLEVIYP